MPFSPKYPAFSRIPTFFSALCCALIPYYSHNIPLH
ncbi:hypothetical protein BACCAP_04756 [Pseudoflavonifractor capillosus ATCC 29799]|uniref:Uncharacterized protein n=1 Tax=Pseudoflavonifractor capillosus ATCC 29799 TaxID=411467 RepID=A6P2M4_9FIRM|nr:hypothetical protein BACCAP_04756 [Pseudoflavonifractor capillosus ATCC 29799]